MIYKLEWAKKSLENLDSLDVLISQRIIKKASELVENPFSKDIKKLKSMEGYRLRVGDYRVIFDIKKDKISVLKVGHRKHIYD
ncbi:MAG: type II toxin-antitoxin system RelE/ParE family toxin [Nanoarchaeota archaeon]